LENRMNIALHHLAAKLLYVASATLLAVGTLGLLILNAGCTMHPTKKLVATSAEPSAGSNASQALMAAQAPLVIAAEEISNLDKGGTGLGGIRLQVDKRVLDVWWKGEPPAAVREAIARHSRDSGIKVNLQQSKYSQRELNEAARSVVANRDRDTYRGLVRVGPRVDGSGLVVGVTKLTDAARIDFPVPVEVVVENPFISTSRANDTAPWWAGGVTTPVLPAGNALRQCSTGFAVGRVFSKGILTANHCSFGGGLPINDGAGELIGVAEPRPTGNAFLTDSLYIVTNSSARIFDGGVGIGEFSKPVAGLTGTFPGQFVCTSGAGTGAHCDIRIDSINNHSVLFLPEIFFVDGIVMATQISGGVANGAGDSGGPVFTLSSDFSKVFAAGMIVGGQNPTPCQIAGQGVCFNRVLFVDLGMILINHDVALLRQ
jgi:hypothetical protein